MEGDGRNLAKYWIIRGKLRHWKEIWRPSMKTIRMLMIGSVCIALFFSTGCSLKGSGVYVGEAEPTVKKGGPPPWAPAHGYRAKHAYHYYPDASVYFDISRKLYFYLEGDEWRAGVSLPGSLHVQLGDYVTIEMDTDKPYTYYKEHRAAYPSGQAKKKDKWAKKNGK